jgi:hypothetical protein
MGARPGDPRLWHGDDLGRRYPDLGGVHAEPHEAAGLERPAAYADDDALRPVAGNQAQHRGQGSELQAALLRLQTTSITTSIRATKRRQKAGFNWLDSWTFDTDADTEQPRGMTLTLSDWVYEGIVNEKSLLTMHPDYFLLSGGL